MLALRWGNVELDSNASRVIKIREALEQTKAHGIRFKPAKTKAGRRDITLLDFVVETLRLHRRQQLEQRLALGLGRPQDETWSSLPSTGGPMSPRAVSSGWRDVAEAVGLKGITFHALRHTHASQLIVAGVDVVTISKRLGHASPTITLKVYAHLFTQSDAKAADASNAALAGPAKA